MISKQDTAAKADALTTQRWLSSSASTNTSNVTASNTQDADSNFFEGYL